jgi:hypothetical protein
MEIPGAHCERSAWTYKSYDLNFTSARVPLAPRDQRGAMPHMFFLHPCLLRRLLLGTAIAATLGVVVSLLNRLIPSGRQSVGVGKAFYHGGRLLGAHLPTR